MKPASNFTKQRKKSSGKSGQSGEIRIIGGQWRGRKLKVHDKDGLRPTTDRLKETLFNWLMTDIRNAVVLDCFAGAGSLGFEAASRHAAQVYCIEKDKQAAAQLSANVKVLNAQSVVKVAQGDFFTQVKIINQAFDLVFIDPPFNKDMVKHVFPALLTHKLIKNGALVYIEQETGAQFNLLNSEWGNQFELIKSKTAGQVSATLFQFTSDNLS